MEIIASAIFGRSAFTFGRIRIIRFTSGSRVVDQTGFTNTPGQQQGGIDRRLSWPMRLWSALTSYNVYGCRLIRCLK